MANHDRVAGGGVRARLEPDALEILDMPVGAGAAVGRERGIGRDRLDPEHLEHPLEGRGEVGVDSGEDCVKL
jgi:hypothetical protein